MITVILNCYKRPNILPEQIDAIKNQSVKAEEILIWSNRPEDSPQYNIDELGCKVIYANTNFKFHGRFTLGFLAKTNYIAFFDDDTIPGTNWFKNCLDTINRGYRGILGATGVVLTGSNYENNYKVGWNGKRLSTVEQVDLVGHAWFFEKKFLHYMWIEEPISWENGEDMQLSYFAQKYGNINTYVPPHPIDDITFWGSHPDKGTIYGQDSNANSIGSFRTHMDERNRIVKEQIDRGWKLVQNK